MGMANQWLVQDKPMPGTSDTDWNTKTYRLDDSMIQRPRIKPRLSGGKKISQSNNA